VKNCWAKGPSQKGHTFCARPVNKTDQKLCVKGVDEIRISKTIINTFLTLYIDVIYKKINKNLFLKK
jgi:hypothetical protein